MINAIDAFLDRLRARLEAGAREYGNQSFLKPVRAIVEEIDQELLDEVGWTYVLWAIARRKLTGIAPEFSSRTEFITALFHRISLNDRGPELLPGTDLRACMRDLEVLAMDMFAHHESVRMRLHPIARAIEVERVLDPDRGRRGSSGDPRSSD